MKQPNSLMTKFLDAVTTNAFGKSLTDAKNMQECVICEGQHLTFKDTLSEKEYKISGMCQSCQDKVFTGEDNDL